MFGPSSVLDRSVECSMPHNTYPPAQQSRTHPPRTTRPTTARGPLLWSLAAVGLLIGLFLAGATIENFGHADDTVAATTGQPKATSPTKAGGKPKGAGLPTGKAPRPPGLGDPVRDGKFEFVVSSAECASSVGNKLLNLKADGKYCVVDLTVKNIADKPQFFLGSAQKAFDAAGTKYTDDKVAGFYANGDTKTFVKKISPGEKVAGKVVFDVPKATTLTLIELHDSFFSGGVQVVLKQTSGE